MGKKNNKKKAGDSAAGETSAPATTGAEGQQQVAPQTARPDTQSSSQQPGPSQGGNVQQSRQGDEAVDGSKKQGKGGKQKGAQQGQEQQQGGPQQAQQHRGSQQEQRGQQQQQSSQKQGQQQGGQKGQQQQKGPQQGQQQQRGTQQEQRGQQQQKGPQQIPQQQGGPQQGQQQQRGHQQGQQQQRGHQQAPQQQGGPQQGQQQQRGPQQGEQQQWGQQQQRGPQQGQQQQRGPQQGQQQQRGPQQAPQQQGGPQQGQQQQRGPQQGEQQQWGQQQQRGPQQGQQHQRGPQQGQQQQRGPQQGQQQQWGPQQGQQQQRGPQQGQQQRGPQQGQQQQWGPQHGQQQQRGGPQQGQQQQRGPQQGQQQQQRGPQQGQQQQWGPQQGQQRGPQQDPRGEQQRGSQQGPQQRQQQQQQWSSQQGQQPQRGPQQGQQQQQQYQQKTPAESARSSPCSSSSSLLSTASKGSIPRGTKGRPGTVEVNYLNLDLDRMPDVAYHYDVSINPDRPKKFFRRAFEQFNRQFFPNIAMVFDGKASAYTVERLKRSSAEEDVEIDDTGARKITFKVAIKETQDCEVDLGALRRYFNDRIFDKPMRPLQCLEVVLANPCHQKAVRVGRSFFRQPAQRMDLGDGYEMWTGLYQSIILGDEPFLNVDVSNKSFPSACNLVDYIGNNFRNCNLNQALDYRNCNALRSFLRGMNIEYQPPSIMSSIKKTYKVLDVSEESANRLMFQLEDGTRLSVAAYFESKNYKLRYPALNCIKVGSTVKANYLPIELCNIPPGQALNKKDESRQVQQMIKYAATSTNVRKDKIMDMLSYFQHNSDEKVRDFGIRIGNAFKAIPMRILQSPSVEYYARELITPFKGAWRMNTNSKFLITKQNTNGHLWAVIYSKRGEVNFNTLQRFAGMVFDLSSKLGMTLAPKPDIIPFERVDQVLKELKGKKYDLVFVVIPTRGPTKYSDIKQAAELQIGQLTQCIKENTIQRRCDVQTVSNILLKVNGKLNGTNHKINAQTNVPLNNVMFLGADVTHPSPDQKHIPSVVGVAASHDADGACYNMQYRLQKSTVENIEDMSSIFMHHMSVYFKSLGKYPEHIIYYRDGVSDGQFPIVRDNELRDIRAVCTKLRISPKITCIVVVKRHHTRFFPQTFNQRDKFNNVEPGTVVDKVIVHPKEVEFFMVSHQSIQGTAKPTRYNVIVDEAKMNIDDLQKLTYNLCHMFPRCNRVVSYPAPAYLAHLVAFRGRVYIEGAQRFGNLKQEYERRLVNADFMKCNPMYFI